MTHNNTGLSIWTPGLLARSPSLAFLLMFPCGPGTASIWLKICPEKEFSEKLTGSTDALELQPGLPHGIHVAHQPCTSSLATKIISDCYERRKSKAPTNLTDLLCRSFSLKHREITTEDGDLVELPKDDEANTGGAAAKKSKPKKPECWQIGVCICSEQGHKLYQLWNRFINRMKSQFPASGLLRKSLLKASKVFVLLRAPPQDQDDEEQPLEQFAWHIGFQYLTPFRPTFRDVVTFGNVDIGAASVPVLGSNNYFTIWPAMQKLSLNRSWFAKFYRIGESDRSLGSFEPANATMIPLQPGEVQFWPPTRSRSARHNPDDLDSDPDDNDGLNESEDEEAKMEALVEESFDAMVKARAGGDGKDDRSGHGHGDGACVDASNATGSAAEEPVAMEDNGDGNSSDSSSSSSSSSSSALVRLRGNADAAVAVPGGVIRYYENKNQFTATCGNPDHGKCIVTRTSRAAANASTTMNQNIAAKGRPLGFLTSWLALSEHTVDKDEHWDRDNAPDWATRIAARASLSHIAGADDLLKHERAQHAGEGTEPEGLA